MGKSNYTVPAVDKSLDILEYLCRYSRVSLTQIHQDLQLPKSTTYGILYTLEKRGYLVRDADSGYKLGFKLYELGIMSVEHIDFIKEALPTMKEMAHKTGLTCNLGVLEGNVGVYLEKVDAPSLIRLNSWKGKRIPLHCTALGKVFLAHKRRSEIEELLTLESLEKFTEYTITEKEKLFQELDAVKKQGYAIDNQEHELDITCVAAPIFNHTKTLVATISLSGLSNWLEPAKLQSVIEDLSGAGLEISKRIGG